MGENIKILKIIKDSISDNKMFKYVFVDEMQKIIRGVTTDDKEFTITVDFY